MARGLQDPALVFTIELQPLQASLMHIVHPLPVAGFQPGIVIRDIVHRVELHGPQGQGLQRRDQLAATVHR